MQKYDGLQSPLMTATDVDVRRTVCFRQPSLKASSLHTIDTHREHIKQKLDIKNAAALHRAAVRWGLESG